MCVKFVFDRINNMPSYNKKDWINVLDTGQTDLFWAMRKYKYPKYMFADDYNRQKVKEDILKSHRIKDAIAKVCFIR